MNKRKKPTSTTKATSPYILNNPDYLIDRAKANKTLKGYTSKKPIYSYMSVNTINPYGGSVQVSVPETADDLPLAPFKTREDAVNHYIKKDEELEAARPILDEAFKDYLNFLEIRGGHKRSFADGKEIKFTIPSSYEGNPNLRGTTITQPMMDSIYVNARKNNIPFSKLLALGVGETTYGSESLYPSDYFFNHTYNNAEDHPYMKSLGWAENKKYNRETDVRGAEEIMLRNAKNINNAIQRLKTHPLTLDPYKHTVELFKSGNYNRNHKEQFGITYEEKVDRNEKELQFSPEYQQELKRLRDKYGFKNGGRIRRRLDSGGTLNW